MKIINLIENTEGTKQCLVEHGLSFYIETRKHKLLVDTGATDAFIQNAETLGIDLSQVDLLILSHGHYDHAGGILEFAKKNKTALIYMQKNAVDEYYNTGGEKEKYIGIDNRIKELSQIVFVDGSLKMDEELTLFSEVRGRKLFPEGNKCLKCQKGGQFIQDDFSHEQYLVISGSKGKVLVSGCAHNGILNILERYNDIYGENPAAVISGFHMRKKSGYSDLDVELIEQTARELQKTETMFYTGHCTGEFPYEIMKKIMGEQLVYVHSGDEITGY